MANLTEQLVVEKMGKELRDNMDKEILEEFAWAAKRQSLDDGSVKLSEYSKEVITELTGRYGLKRVLGWQRNE